VCRYNRSSHTLISCCSCYESCQWGELSGHNELDHPSCQLNTSQPGLYQFQINTINYSCYFNIGDPIDVSYSSTQTTHNQHVPFHVLGVSTLLLLFVGIVMMSLTYKHCKKRYADHGKLFIVLVYILIWLF